MTLSNKLKNAIKRKSDRESLRQCFNHGANSGINGFIYYHETLAFYKRHKSDIIDALKDLASDLGENLLTMIAGFNCLKGADYSEEIAMTLYGKPSQIDTTIANALVWFAVEECAREMFDK